MAKTAYASEFENFWQPWQAYPPYGELLAMNERAVAKYLGELASAERHRDTVNTGTVSPLSPAFQDYLHPRS